MNGKIVKIISNDYTILSDKKIYICKPRGKFRNMKLTPLVGDDVLFDNKNNYIMEIKKRKNELVRPPVSNIDQAIIVTSVKNPDFSPYLLDKLLVIIEYNNILPIIIISKMDLLSSEEKKHIDKYIEYYKNIGYKVFINTEIDEIKKIFKNKITVFTGQSGAGKSTLLNKIDNNLNIKTNEISYALGRGKHTTRHVELLSISNGLVADTPGFSSIDFNGMSKQDIKDNFIDFNKYRDECKYRDCMHDKEDDCIIKSKIKTGEILQERYDNYIKFINESR